MKVSHCNVISKRKYSKQWFVNFIRYINTPSTIMVETYNIFILYSFSHCDCMECDCAFSLNYYFEPLAVKIHCIIVHSMTQSEISKVSNIKYSSCWEESNIQCIVICYVLLYIPKPSILQCMCILSMFYVLTFEHRKSSLHILYALLLVVFVLYLLFIHRNNMQTQHSCLICIFLVLGNIIHGTLVLH